MEVNIVYKKKIRGKAQQGKYTDSSGLPSSYERIFMAPGTNKAKAMVC